MKSVNTYGIKIKGLKKASGETENHGAYSGKYDEVFYDRTTGEVWTKFHYSLGENEWTVYHDENVVKVCTTSRHMTMQEIMDAIKSTLDHEQ